LTAICRQWQLELLIFQLITERLQQPINLSKVSLNPF
jgi:hypothetical protein